MSEQDYIDVETTQCFVCEEDCDTVVRCQKCGEYFCGECGEHFKSCYICGKSICHACNMTKDDVGADICTHCLDKAIYFLRNLPNIQKYINNAFDAAKQIEPAGDDREKDLRNWGLIGAVTANLDWLKSVYNL